jgi:hypothetical protein
MGTSNTGTSNRGTSNTGTSNTGKSNTGKSKNKWEHRNGIIEKRTFKNFDLTYFISFTGALIPQDGKVKVGRRK